MGYYAFEYCSISGSASVLSMSSQTIGRKRSCTAWKITKRLGTMNIWNIIPINMPPTAAVPRERLPLAPTPKANIIGRRPIIIANDVMRIGRRRAPAPSTAAHVMLMPILRRSSANSTIRIAFFANRPISMISEICV